MPCLLPKRFASLPLLGEDCAEQVRRVGHLARILGEAGVVPLVALVSPFRADRDAVRALHVAGRFLEVHVATPLAVCAERDVKGLYGDAAAGRVVELTGVGQDYEAPERPELVLDGSGGVDVEGSARRVVERVRATLGG